MTVKVKQIPTKNGAVSPLPKYQSEFSAGADLTAAIDEAVTIAPHARALIPTGIAIEPSDNGIGAFIFARSGLASKHGICLANSVGVVDADYRGEIKVALWGVAIFVIKIGVMRKTCLHIKLFCFK